ncbi:MAG: hypothetical protein A2Y38_10245 [Spirochaetes bacterium GWB1_59_5]|nr:MAG: hypothetical protein A2Y38_10245 [Spirochaetes bacterium GWB1_59_5]
MPKVTETEMDEMGVRLVAQARETVGEVAPKIVSITRDMLETLAPLQKELEQVEKIIEIAKSLGMKEALPIKEDGLQNFHRIVNNAVMHNGRLVQALHAALDECLKLQTVQKPHKHEQPQQSPPPEGYFDHNGTKRQ